MVVRLFRPLPPAPARPVRPSVTPFAAEVLSGFIMTDERAGRGRRDAFARQVSKLSLNSPLNLPTQGPGWVGVTSVHVSDHPAAQLPQSRHPRQQCNISRPNLALQLASLLTVVTEHPSPPFLSRCTRNSGATKEQFSRPNTRFLFQHGCAKMYALGCVDHAI